MKTQRINSYIAGSGLRVFYIEQFDPELRDWFTVGDTYTLIEHASAVVEHHNLKQLWTTTGLLN